MSEEKDALEVKVFGVKVPKWLIGGNAEESIKWACEEIKSLESRLKEAEEHIKDISGIKARACEARNDALGELEEAKQRLSQAEAELKQYKNPAKGASDPAVWVELPPITDEGWQEDPRVKELKSRLSHLMDVAVRLSRNISRCIESGHLMADELQSLKDSNRVLIWVDVERQAKLALAEWDGIKK